MMSESPRRHSTSLNGPTQSTCVASAALPAFSTKPLRTSSWNGSIAGRIGHGVARLMRTVCGSTTSTLATGPSRSLRGLVCPPIALSFVRRSSVNLTSSAVSTAPLWNFTFLRIFSSHVLASTCRYDSATSGTIFIALSRVSRPSHRLRMIVSVSRLRWLAGSSVSASCEKPTRRSAAVASAAGTNASAAARATHTALIIGSSVGKGSVDAPMRQRAPTRKKMACCRSKLDDNSAVVKRAFAQLRMPMVHPDRTSHRLTERRDAANARIASSLR